jgi:hypothetical protein
MIKIKYNNTSIRCVNMPNCGNTLIVAHYNDEIVSFILKGQEIAKSIIKNKYLIKLIFNKIKDEYELYRTLLNS